MSSEAIQGHQYFFANNLRSKSDTYMRLVSMRLSRQGALIDMQFDLFGSPHDIVCSQASTML